MNDDPAPARNTPLGIVAGGGALPLRLIRYCRESGRQVFVIGFDKITDPATLSNAPHAVVRPGAVGEAMDYLRSAGAEEIVLAGHMKRPSLAGLRPDAAGARLLRKLGGALLGGDDKLLRTVVQFLEEEGFRVTAPEKVLTSLLMPEGLLTRCAPDETDLHDIALGARAARAIGALDIGQAVVVQHGHVLGLEAAEGTDALIKRCASLRRAESGGALVKVKKPGQEARVDMPSIGPSTVLRLHEAGFAGIACEAGGSLLIEREETVRKADTLGLFLIGIRLDG